MNIFKEELKEDKKLTYAALLDGARAMESAHKKFPLQVPLQNVIEARNNARKYKINNL